MPKLLRYCLIFASGCLLGALFLWIFRPQLLSLGLARRASLRRGAISTSEDSPQQISQITPAPASPPSIKILFTGDVMLDRHVRTLAQNSEQGYFSLLDEPLQQLLKEQDLVVINLEGPITDQASVSVGSEPGSVPNYRFTFEPAVTEFLSAHQMFLANLGNNHILDFGHEGLISTLNYLHQAGIEHFGWVARSPDLEEYNREVILLELHDFLLGFVNLNQFSNQQFSQVLETVEEVRPQADYLIVYTHWGEEYQSEPSAQIKLQAQQLVEAGADLIIGTHPHVIQPMEEINDSRVYYSLGNFIFDQYFSEEVKRGMLVQLELEKIQAEDDNKPEKLQVVFSEYCVKMEVNQAVSLVE